MVCHLAYLAQLKLTLAEDVISSPSTASVVKEINGIDAATYIADFAYTASFNQDADAAYNTMFFEKAFVAGGTSSGYFSGGGRIRYAFIPPSPRFLTISDTSTQVLILPSPSPMEQSSPLTTLDSSKQILPMSLMALPFTINSVLDLELQKLALLPVYQLPRTVSSLLDILSPL